MNQFHYAVLIVEPSAENRERYQQYLREEADCRYTIYETATAIEGVEIWERDRPDLVLLNYNLPDANGLDFLAQLSASSQTAKLPAIVILRQDDERYAGRVIKAGAEDYLLEEDLTARSLQESIRETIGRSQLASRLQQCRDRERLIGEVSRKIYRSLDIDRILQIAADETRNFLQSDRVLIFRLQSDGWGSIVTESVGEGWTPLLSTRYYDSCFNERYLEPFRRGWVVQHSDIRDGSMAPCYVELLEKLQVRANLVVPIVVAKRLWGLAIVHQCSAPRQWQVCEIDALKDVVLQLGIALRNAELYDRVQIELTERHRVEAALRASQSKLQEQLGEIEALYQNAPIGLSFLDPELRFVRINEKLAEMNGFSVSDHIGRTVRELLPLLADSAEEMLLPILKTGEPRLNVKIIGETPAQPGIKRTWLEHFVPLKQGDRVIGINIVCEEITERERTEQSLRESERKFATLAEASPVVILRFDNLGNCTYINQRWQEITGLPIEKCLGLEWANFLYPDDRDRLTDAWLNWIQKARRGDLYQNEGRFIGADGKIIWYSIQALPDIDESNNFVGSIGVLMDITESVRAREAAQRDREIIRTQLAEIETTYQTAPIGLAIVDRYGRYSRINERMAEINGLPVGDHIGKTLREILPDLADRLEPLFQYILETGEPVRDLEIEGETPARPGFVQAWLINWFPIKDDDGRTVGVNMAVLEITDRKQTERQLREQAQELRRLNRSLETSTDELAERNKELSRFAYAVSHDLKAPLRAIANLSVWIEEDFGTDIPEEIQKYLDLLRKRVERMENLIDGLLTYSRIGRLEVATEVTDVARLVDEVVDSLMPPPSFNIKLCASLPIFVTRRSLLFMVFANLIGNAIKHHDRPSGRVEIACTERENNYEFTVTDDGPGIPPEYREKVFQIFQTLASRDVRESTGIGLAIVKKIIETEGGAIGIESASGRGTTFRFTWPKFSAEAEAVAEVAAEIEGK